jgi:hypothetical protein
MNLKQRIDLLVQLGDYMKSNDESWQDVKTRAFHENGWFIPEFIDLSVSHITNLFLQKDILEKWVKQYAVPESNSSPKTIGIVMAGNIPLVGFHDLLCVFISGHKALIKASSKDERLITHLVGKMIEWNEEVNELVRFSDMLKNCYAYIATGSNNSAAYFEYYFNKYPHIIRRNRTSVAILTGNETANDLQNLADDVYLYFGRGCRNVTHVYVPEGYDFIPMLRAFDKYDRLADFNKYKNNYDYNLALLVLNKKFYMSNTSILLTENASPFSPVSQLHYSYYTDKEKLEAGLKSDTDIQCIAGKGCVPFGLTQYPAIKDYADGVDTLQFCVNL